MWFLAAWGVRRSRSCVIHKRLGSWGVLEFYGFLAPLAPFASRPLSLVSLPSARCLRCVHISPGTTSLTTITGPCKQVAPKIEALSKEETNVAFYKIDVDEVPDVASELGVRAMPTFYFYREGVKVAEVVGANIRAVTVSLFSSFYCCRSKRQEGLAGWRAGVKRSRDQDWIARSPQLACLSRQIKKITANILFFNRLPSPTTRAKCT